MAIRPANIKDASRIAEIHVTSWRQAYNGFISHEFLFNTFTVKMREEKITYALENRLEETYVYEEDNIIKGFLTIGECRDEDKDVKCFELWGVYVDPFFFRKGIGRRFVHYCIEEARNRKKNEIILWVFEKNKESRLFYENLGFQVDGEKKYMEYFKENAIRYSKKI